MESRCVVDMRCQAPIERLAVDVFHFNVERSILRRVYSMNLGHRDRCVRRGILHRLNLWGVAWPLDDAVPTDPDGGGPKFAAKEQPAEPQPQPQPQPLRE